MCTSWPVWLSWLEHHLVHQKVMDSIPSQGTYPGWGFNPWSMCTGEGIQLLSLSLSLKTIQTHPQAATKGKKKCMSINWNLHKLLIIPEQAPISFSAVSSSGRNNNSNINIRVVEKVIHKSLG